MYVIGTAGHVDHGKSTLVKALTGIDPDRWEEEQRREMTIDLGFAWLTLPSGREVSLIDVPGHERFIKNMLAGVGGIDAALLVIAADEAIMPQTDEHIAILDLLGVDHGLVVLTKTDLVDAEWLELVQEEVRERLRATTFAAVPVVPVSARSGQGLDELKSAIDRCLDQTPSRTSGQAAPRLSVDRSFTVGGFGTVVTGTLSDGPLRVGDEVEVLPKQLRARVRGLQTHHHKQETALPGTRVAVNLSGISHRDVARGDMLALPGKLGPTDLIDVQVRLLADAPQALEQNTPLDLFVGAAEVGCRVTVLEKPVLLPGESGWLQLRLERPIAVARGDRYILRRPSPSSTIGGGRVIDTHPPRHRRFRADVIQALESLARGTPADLLRRPLADALPHAWAELLQHSGLGETAAREGLAELLASGEVLLLTGRDSTDTDDDSRATPAQAWVIASAGWEKLREKLVVAVRGYHKRYPLRSGIPREELRSRLKLSGAALEAVLSAASSTELVVQGENTVRLPDHTPAPQGDQARQAQRFLATAAATPYSPPAPDLDPELLGWLLEQGQLVRVADDVVYLAATYHELVEWVRGQLRETGSLTVAQFRDRFGTSRKYALALLEHLDERRITRRQGDVRVMY